MTKFTAIMHRFGAAFLAGGLGTLTITFAVIPQFSTITDVRRFVVSAAVAFIFGGIFAIEKAIQQDYPGTAVIAPFIAAETTAVQQKVVSATGAPVATVTTSISAPAAVPTGNGGDAPSES